MKKQDLDRLNHNAKAEINKFNRKDRKPLMFGENKMLATRPRRVEANKDGLLQLAEQPL